MNRSLSRLPNPYEPAMFHCLPPPPPLIVPPYSALMLAPVYSRRRMKLMTPAMASDPYTADAPSFRTSTRSIAWIGMLLTSIDADSPTLPYGATRRPLTRINVRVEPRPLNDAVERPPVFAPALLAETVMPAASIAVIVRNNCSEVVTPVRAISCAVITWTGNDVSASIRLMAEPVTSTRSRLCAGRVESVAPMRQVPSPLIQRRTQRQSRG